MATLKDLITSSLFTPPFIEKLQTHVSTLLTKLMPRLNYYLSGNESKERLARCSFP